MPRKAKKKPADSAGSKPTYHKSKNGRYYKKTKLPSGKCRCRFVSKAEAEGAGGTGSSEAPKKRARKAKPKKVAAEAEP